MRIAVGHGIQNYSCATSSTAAAAQLGALAVLYDVTDLYPGTPSTGLDADTFNSLPISLLWNQSIPLNLVNETAAIPGTPQQPNALPESQYGADVTDPFPSPAPAVLASLLQSRPPAFRGVPAELPFLGHHFFDASGTPNFDLAAANLYATVNKTASVAAPASADLGVLGSGAVPWLRLDDSGKDLSRGLSTVYRVLTAGGAAEACATSGAGSGSVPYAAFYWFYAETD